MAHFDPVCDKYDVSIHFVPQSPYGCTQSLASDAQQQERRTMTTSNIFRLKSSIQQYEWGKPGNSSLVAKYARTSIGEDCKISESENYAEVRV